MTDTRLYIGIDNGSTGTIGMISSSGYVMHETPVEKRLNYTKKKQFINMLDIYEFEKLFWDFIDESTDGNLRIANTKVFIERPLVNPQMFTATMNAVRLMQSQITVLEILGISYQFIDSKEWQRVMLPEGTKGTHELKLASKDIGIRLFPECRDIITKHKDADGLLIAEYARRKGL